MIPDLIARNERPGDSPNANGIDFTFRDDEGIHKAFISRTGLEYIWKAGTGTLPAIPLQDMFMAKAEFILDIASAMAPESAEDRIELTPDHLASVLEAVNLKPARSAEHSDD